MNKTEFRIKADEKVVEFLVLKLENRGNLLAARFFEKKKF